MTDKTKIVNCYTKDSYSGFGDFLRGSIYLFNLCKENNIDFGICLNNHPISKFIKFKNNTNSILEKIDNLPYLYDKSEKKIGLHQFCDEETNKIISVVKNMVGGEKYIFSNFHNILLEQPIHLMNHINKLELDFETRNFFSKSLYFSEQINLLSERFLKDNKLQKKEFDLYHFRFGDLNSFTDSKFYENHFVQNWEPDYEYCFNILKHNKNSPIILISDSNEFKNFVSKKAKEFNLPIFIPHLNSGHTQSYTGIDLKHNKSSYFYSALDMKFLTLSKSVKAQSVYRWGSGFCSWLSKIYCIPFSCKPILKPIV